MTRHVNSHTKTDY